MTDLQTLSRRIDELEIHLAHQDQVIDDLSKTIAKQWRDIEELTRKLGKVGDRLHVIEESANEPAPAEPPPPHY